MPGVVERLVHHRVARAGLRELGELALVKGDGEQQQQRGRGGQQQGERGRQVRAVSDERGLEFSPWGLPPRIETSTVVSLLAPGSLLAPDLPAPGAVVVRGGFASPVTVAGPRRTCTGFLS